MHGAGVRYVRLADGLPGDELSRNVVDDLGVPFDPGACRSVRDPVRSPVTEVRYRLEMIQHLRQVREIPPEFVDLACRLPDRDRPLDLDRLARVDRRCCAPDVLAMPVVSIPI